VDWVHPPAHSARAAAPNVAIYVIDLFRENSAYSRIAAPDEQGQPALLGRSSHMCAMRAIGPVVMFHVEPGRAGLEGRLPEAGAHACGLAAIMPTLDSLEIFGNRCRRAHPRTQWWA
jgi:hypothetical protein